MKLTVRNLHFVLIVVLFILLSSFVFNNFAFADLLDPGQDARNYLDIIGEFGFDRSSSGPPEVSLAELIFRIVKISLSFLGVLFVVLIIYGGFLWMTAAGNDDQIRRARKIMINSAIGLLIVLASLAFSWFVFKSLGKAIG